MSTYGIPPISELILRKYRLKEWWRGVGVAGFVDCIWDPGIPHMERNSTGSEKQMWPNESVGETVSERLMYATAVPQGNTIQTFLLPPPKPNMTPPAPRSPLSASLMSWTVRQGIPAPFVVFKEELGGRSGGVDFGESDRWESSRGRRTSRFKEGLGVGGRGWGGDRQDRSQGVKIPFKRSSPGEKKPAGHKSRPRDTWESETPRDFWD